MSARFNFTSAGPLRSSNLETIPTTAAERPQQASALDLPGEHKFGLVSLRKAGPDSLAAKICAHLDETGIPYPTKPHWIALRSEGYVTLETTRHQLTPKGNAAAEAIMRDLAIKSSVHHVTIRPKLVRSNMGPMASCSCGQWHRVVGRSRSDEARLRRMAGEHLEQVKNGTFKKPRSIDKFLNEYMPLRLPLRRPDQTTTEIGDRHHARSR